MYVSRDYVQVSSEKHAMHKKRFVHACMRKNCLRVAKLKAFKFADLNFAILVLRLLVFL